MIKTLNRIVLSLAILFLFSTVVPAQTVGLTRNNLNQIEVEQIIKKFTKNEDDFRFALTNYVFNRSATIQTVGLGGLITGTYRRDSFMTFSKDGTRFEKINYAPVSTLRGLQITKEDIDDLGGVNPFAINPRDASLYSFSYMGKQKIDDLNLHVFDVRPKLTGKKLKKSKKRFFIGRVWVDDRDFMIVKSKGKGIPEGKQRFPVVETWRINVDGKYWFPAYSSTDDELVFPDGQVIKMRMRVRYENYRQGRSDVTILDDVEEKPADKKKDENQPSQDN